MIFSTAVSTAVLLRSVWCKPYILKCTPSPKDQAGIRLPPHRKIKGLSDIGQCTPSPSDPPTPELELELKLKLKADEPGWMVTIRV